MFGHHADSFLFMQLWCFTMPKCFKIKMRILFCCHGNDCKLNDSIKNITYSQSIESSEYKNISFSASTFVFRPLFKTKVHQTVPHW